MVEEDRRNKLPANWEARKRKAEWELADQEAKKVCFITLTEIRMSLADFKLLFVNLICLVTSMTK